MTINFVGAATKLVPADWNRAAAKMGCEIAAMRAVGAVESSGASFLSDKRPIILFESAVFSRLTSHAYDYIHPDISTRTWMRNYGAGGSHQYDRLAKAMQLDEMAALEATSWGMFQILGMNYAACGFGNVHNFVAAQTQGEPVQLDSFVQFNLGGHLNILLARHEWSKYAVAYNGINEAANHYDEKLAQAYSVFSRRVGSGLLQLPRAWQGHAQNPDLKGRAWD